MEPSAIRQAISKQATAGWKMELGVDYLGKDRTLLLYLPGNFPHDPPRAHVWPTAYQEWPHAEPSGRLCLWREDEPPDCSSPSALVEDYFNRIGQLLTLVRPGADQELRRLEFQDEWLSYWIPANKKRVSRHNYLVSPPPAAIMPLYHQTLIRAGTERNDKGRVRTPGGFWNPVALFSSDVEEIRQWGADLVEVNRISDNASSLYIPLHDITTPGMPESVPALRVWLRDCGGPEALAALDEALQRMQTDNSRLFVLLGLQTNNGTAIAGLTVQVKERGVGPPRGWGRRSGARVAHPIWEVGAMSVARADRGWTRDRCIDHGTAALEGKHVVVIGCGMLGSPIAEGLARAGVGCLTLIDSDELDAANIGRHVLGASYLGQGKAAALAHHIRATIPTAKVMPIGEDLVAQQKCNVFEPGIDLVICTTADKRCEQFLMAERFAHGAPGALLICWLEPYAVAGHALVSSSPSERLVDLFSSRGDFRKPCVDWPNGIPAHRVPACQAAFQPAGMATAVPTIAMCTSAVLDYLLHRRSGSAHLSWCADAKTVQSVGGSLAAHQEHLPGLAVSERPLFS
jgi:sulfur-carrier protein adenylyltransferase/sulfurtransferase